MQTILNTLKSLPIPESTYHGRRQFIDSLPALGIGQHSIPELIEIINNKALYDNGTEAEFFALVYAADALAGLQAKEALPHLFAQLYRTEWQYEDDWISHYSQVFFWYGPDIIPLLVEQLKLLPLVHLGPIISALNLFAAQDTEYRNIFLIALDQLYDRLLASNTPIDEPFNHPAHDLINAWLDLNAADKIEQIRYLHTTYQVEDILFGDMAYIEYLLGLGKKPARAYLNGPKPFVRQITKIGRNDPCPCGSGKKLKKCCIDQFG